MRHARLSCRIKFSGHWVVEHSVFVEGTSNVRASFKDHSVTDMHTRAMALFRNSATNVTEDNKKYDASVYNWP